MKKSLNWPAPAKINLFLHVTGMRSDGYHSIQTFFQFVEIADEINLLFRSEDVVIRKGVNQGVAESDDLTVRAARLLKSTCHVKSGVEIELKKNIPMGGGLGGGSSDAATVLVALNEIWGLGLTLKELVGIGLELGADVPVFIVGHATWAEGVGEILYRQDTDESPILLLFPRIVVSTAKVFQSPELTRDSTPIKMDTSYLSEYRNDCEAATRTLYPEVAEAIDWLSKYGDAQMSGTGSSVFAVFDRLSDAERIVPEIPAKWSGVACRTLNRSPLLDRLRSFRRSRSGVR